jgi:hypothetical protein
VASACKYTLPRGVHTVHHWLSGGLKWKKNIVYFYNRHKLFLLLLTPLKSFPIPCGIRTPPGLGPDGYRGPPINGCWKIMNKQLGLIVICSFPFLLTLHRIGILFLTSSIFLTRIIIKIWYKVPNSMQFLFFYPFLWNRRWSNENFTSAL